MNDIPSELLKAIDNGHEETYLEYKGDVAWTGSKKLEILQTILAMANKNGGGVIVIGVNDNGEKVGLSEANFITYSHDNLNQSLVGKSNQSLSCKLSKHKYLELDGSEKNIVTIQVNESKEFPVVYIGGQRLFNDSAPPSGSNIALRKSAIYIRNSTSIGNKEIETVEEWIELIERTYKKYERETIRRRGVLSSSEINPFDAELNV